MGMGAIITIDYSIAFGINSFTQSPSNGGDMFSGILDPLRKAKSAGSIIKSELHSIASRIDLTTSIGKFFSSDDGEYKLQNEISEEAKVTKGEEVVVFGTTVIDVDNKAALLIRERKLEFNRRYPHLESETEYRQRMDDRSGWEKAGDFLYGFVHGYGLIGGFDSLINGRERFEQHKEAIEQKIAEFATKTWNWVKENWEAIVAAIVVVAAAIVCIATFGAGTVFLVASLAAFAYAVADKIVAINNNGNGIVQTLEANGFHHFSQICKGLNWGLQITMLISGFGMEGASSFSLFEGSGFFATVGNGAVFGGGYNLAVDLTAHSLNFTYSKEAQSDPMGYLKYAFKDTLKDTISGFVIGGTVAGISYSAAKGISFFRSKLTTPKVGEFKNYDNFNITQNNDGTFNVNGKTYTRNELINPQTGEFSIKAGEFSYNSNNVYKNSFNIKSDPRNSIQIDGVQSMIERNPDYFKQFGCEKTNAEDIVKWFGKKENSPYLMLHETINNKIQIVPRDLNAVVKHGGGNSMEKVTREFWNNYDGYISEGFNNPSSKMWTNENGTPRTLQDMYDIFNKSTDRISHDNFDIDILKRKNKTPSISDIFGYDLP